MTYFIIEKKTWCILHLLPVLLLRPLSRPAGGISKTEFSITS